MIPQGAKDAIERLNLEYCPVAVKFCFNKPQGYEFFDTDIPFCHHLKNVQSLGKTYYIEVAKDRCFGKHILGCEPVIPFFESGAVGYQHGIYKQQSCNQNIYHHLKFFKENTCNYVIFSPVAECDFDPDLILFVAPAEKSDIIMRAYSWCTADFYEAKSTCVLGCYWLFNYPYIEGKANFVITGMHFGMKKAKAYPAGLQIISIPYQKLQNFYTGIQEIPFNLLAFETDEESKATVAKRYELFDNSHDKEFEINPNFRIQ